MAAGLLAAASSATALGQPGFTYTGLLPIPPFPGPQRLADIGCINYAVNPVNDGVAGPFFFIDPDAGLLGFSEFFRHCMISAGPMFAGVEFNGPTVTELQPLPVPDDDVFGFLPWTRAEPQQLVPRPAGDPGPAGPFGGGSTLISGPMISCTLADHPASNAETASCMYASWSATFTSGVFAQPAVTPLTRFISVGGILPPGSAVAFGLSTYAAWSDGTLQNNFRDLYVGVANDGRQHATLGPVPNPPLLDATVAVIVRVPIPGGGGSVAWGALIIDQTASTMAANIVPGSRYTAYNTFTALADPGATISELPLTQAQKHQYHNLLDNSFLGNTDRYCEEDFNRDHSIDPDDLGDFINCYFSSSSEPPCDRVDFNRDGNLDPDDLGDFINAYFSVQDSAC